MIGAREEDLITQVKLHCENLGLTIPKISQWRKTTKNRCEFWQFVLDNVQFLDERYGADLATINNMEVKLGLPKSSISAFCDGWLDIETAHSPKYYMNIFGDLLISRKHEIHLEASERVLKDAFGAFPKGKRVVLLRDASASYSSYDEFNIRETLNKIQQGTFQGFCNIISKGGSGHTIWLSIHKDADITRIHPFFLDPFGVKVDYA